MKKLDPKKVSALFQQYGYSKRNLSHLAARLTKITGVEHVALGNDIYSAK